MINKVFLVGNIGKEPELKKVGEVSCCTFTLATNESYKDKNGEWQTKTEWHNIVVWRTPAEYADKYLKKGNLTYVEGKITTRSWEDKGGDKKYTTEIVAEKVKLLEKKAKQEQVASDNEQVASDEEEDGDLPF